MAGKNPFAKFQAKDKKIDDKMMAKDKMDPKMMAKAKAKAKKK